MGVHLTENCATKYSFLDQKVVAYNWGSTIKYVLVQTSKLRRYSNKKTKRKLNEQDEQAATSALNFIMGFDFYLSSPF